jgi:nascent polypeptide-associated complex subunit alpha
MAKAMKRMGIQQTELDAKEVIIRLEDKELVFKNPQVAKVNMMGQETFQIIGKPEERSISTEPEISEEDIQTVAEQAGVDKEKALEAIKKHKGDIAAAILELKPE